jgi:outer membrane protein insertion porin family
MQKIISVIVVLLFLYPGSPLPGYSQTGQPGVKSSQDPPDITAVRITIQDAPGLEEEVADLAHDLIALERGQPLTDESLMQAIDALKTSRRFAYIDVQSTQDVNGIALFFTLKPCRLIKNIRVSGEFPLFEKDVLKAMTLYIGGVFTPEALPVQERRIKELYEREGFIDPKVKVEAHQDRSEDAVELHVYIERGPFYRTSGIKIAGNQAFSDFWLKSKMNTWLSSLLPGSSGRFLENDLKEDVKTLVSYYRKRGYPECRIEYTIERHSAEKKMDIVCTIEEGPEYTFSISGNEEFWDYTLRKDLVVFQQGNISDRGLRKSIKNIVQRYIDAGYPEVRIDVQDESAQPEVKARRNLHLTIHEGIRSTITSLAFEGNQAVGSTELREQIYLAEGEVFTHQMLEDDLLALRTFYLRNGFGDAVVDHQESWSQDRQNVSVVFTISEGVQTIITSIRITGVGSVSEEEVYRVLKLEEGSPLRRYMLRSDENAVAALISEKGYPHVTVQAQASLSEDRSRAEVDYTVDEGPLVTMGNIYYQGNFRTREKVVSSEIEIDKGAPFSLKKMLAGQRNIRDLAIFSSVEFNTIGLKEKRSEITLLADMEEKKPYYVQIGGGYESERGLFAQTRAGDHNLFGANKDAWMAGEVSQIGYKAEMGLREPRLFASRISASLGLFSEKRQEFNQKFGTFKYGTSLVLNRKMTRSITAALGLHYEYREEFLQNDGADPADTFDEDSSQPRSILVTTPAIIFDTRDSFIKPTKGVYSSVSIDVSKGIRKSLDNFFKYRFDARYYVTPVERITLAWLGRVGYLDPYGPSDQVPDDQLFYLGGILDVRGFDENLLRFDSNGDPLGGRVSLAGSVEARIDLGRNLELTCFYDIGTVRDTYEDIGSEDFRSSVGLGLRYLTPIGPIGILYGHKLDRKSGESPGRFHFSVGYTF